MRYSSEQVDACLATYRISVAYLETTELSVELVRRLRDQLPPEKREGAYFLFDSLSFIDVIGNSDLATHWVPSDRDSAFVGHLGTLLEMEVFTDAYHHPDKKILPAGQVHVVMADGSLGYNLRLIRRP